MSEDKSPLDLALEAAQKAREYGQFATPVQQHLVVLADVLAQIEEDKATDMDSPEYQRGHHQGRTDAANIARSLLGLPCLPPGTEWGS